MKKIANKYGDLNKLGSRLTLDQFLIGSGMIFMKKQVKKIITKKQLYN